MKIDEAIALADRALAADREAPGAARAAAALRRRAALSHPAIKVWWHGGRLARDRATPSQRGYWLGVLRGLVARARREGLAAVTVERGAGIGGYVLSALGATVARPEKSVKRRGFLGVPMGPVYPVKILKYTPATQGGKWGRSSRLGTWFAR